MDHIADHTAQSPSSFAGAAGPGNDPVPIAPALVFDAAAYHRFVADSDLTEGQERELLEAMWAIIVGFVDLGFHIHPVQQAIAQRPKQKLAADSNTVLASSIRSKFNSRRPARSTQRTGERKEL